MNQCADKPTCRVEIITNHKNGHSRPLALMVAYEPIEVNSNSQSKHGNNWVLETYIQIITFGFHLLGSQTKTANILLSLTLYVITPLSVVITAIFLTNL